MLFMNICTWPIENQRKVEEKGKNRRFQAFGQAVL